MSGHVVDKRYETISVPVRVGITKKEIIDHEKLVLCRPADFTSLAPFTSLYLSTWRVKRSKGSGGEFETLVRFHFHVGMVNTTKVSFLMT